MDGWHGNPFTGFGNLMERWCCHVVQPSQYCIYWIPFAAVLEIFWCIVCSYKIVHFHTNYSSYHIHRVRLVSSPPALQYFTLTPLQLQAPATSQVTVFFSHTTPAPGCRTRWLFNSGCVSKSGCSDININILKNWVCLTHSGVRNTACMCYKNEIVLK